MHAGVICDVKMHPAHIIPELEQVLRKKRRVRRTFSTNRTSAYPSDGHESLYTNSLWRYGKEGSLSKAPSCCCAQIFHSGNGRVMCKLCENTSEYGDQQIRSAAPHVDNGGARERGEGGKDNLT